MKVLANSREIRAAIGTLMVPGAVRRVAISAFIGDGARSYLRNPEGVEIICWPKAGGTNPLELRRLKRAGAKIRFADRLHAKLYWAADRGAVICSANLSTNALGAGDLKEFGVCVDANSIPIDKILKSFKSRPLNSKDMGRLELEHRLLNARRLQRRPKTDYVGFREWYLTPPRSVWKLGWHDSDGVVATNAQEKARVEFDKPRPEDFLGCKKSDHKEGDWVLTFRLIDKGSSRLRWMFVDFVVSVGRENKRAYSRNFPYQAIQVHSAKHYPPPPFLITSEFRKAFSATCTEYGREKIEALKTTEVPRKFLETLARNMGIKTS